MFTPQKKNSPVCEKLAPRKTFKQFDFLDEDGNPLQLNLSLIHISEPTRPY